MTSSNEPPGTNSPKRHRSALADHPDVRDVLPVFVARLAGHAKRARELAAAGDAEHLRRLVHQLRGAGASFGFEAISHYAATIENHFLARGTIEEVMPELERLLAYIENVEGYAG